MRAEDGPEAELLGRGFLECFKGVGFRVFKVLGFRVEG